MVYKWSSFHLLPGICAICGSASERDLDLCQTCEAALPFNHQCCQRCAEPLLVSAPNLDCGRCQQQVPPFDKTVAPLIYRDSVIAMIHRFKYHRRRAYGRLLSALLANEIADQYRDEQLPELLLPVPMHWRRILWRGGNHTTELGRWLSRELDIPTRHRVLERSRYTTRQSTLNRRQRLKNLDKAFTVRYTLAAQHIALIDDVMTTGATAATLASLLKRAGAARVDVWVIARTPQPQR